jgi:hypothetical protein
MVDRQPIGIMGNTGLSLGAGKGIHLHFGVYFDPDCDGDWSNKVPVDPYPWSGNGADPWQDLPNSGLWKYKVSNPGQINNAGGIASSSGGTYMTTVPAGAASENLTFEILPSPPISAPSGQLRSTGYSFWMRVLEWLQGSNNNLKLEDPSAAEILSNSFNVPVTVTTNFDPLYMPHLDVNQLAILQWNEVDQSWTPLTTTIDPVNNQASAQTSQAGYFDL